MKTAAFIVMSLVLMVLGGAATALSAEVFVHDAVAVSREEIRLTAETRGLYFPKGGVTVDFSLDNRPVGTVLSGGDGIAVRTHTVSGTGLFTLKAKAGKALGQGSVLVLRKGAGIVFVDIEGTVLARPFSEKPLVQSRTVLKNLMKKYPVVYLHSGTLGIQAVKDWLRKNKFPEAPVLPWLAGEVFGELRKKGLHVKAVVGTQAVIESAAEHKPRAFSFEEVSGAVVLKDWQELEKKLK